MTTGEVIALIKAFGGSGGGGGGSSSLVVTPTVTQEGNTITETWDKTAGEIMDAMPFVAYRKFEDYGGGDTNTEWFFITSCSADSSHVFVASAFSSSSGTVEAATRNDYPTGTWTGK